MLASRTVIVLMVSVVCKRYGILVYKYCGEKVDFVLLCYLFLIIFILAFT